MAPQEAFGGGGLNVWAGVMYNGKTELFICHESITALRYRDNIIRPIVVPYAQNYGQDFVLVDDNARPHRARIVMEALEELNIQSLHLPPKSPDLNIIEHVWSRLKFLLRSRLHPPQTMDELMLAMEEEWENISRHFINTLVMSMPNRCRDVANCRGGPSRY